MQSNSYFSNLSGKLLIASPFAMQGSIFHQSVVYLAQHEKEGSVGFMINKNINNLSSDSVLSDLNSELNVNLQKANLEVFLGGPSELQRGFLLHSTDYDKQTIYQSQDKKYAISSNTEIMSKYVSGEGPKNFIFIMGFTNWHPQQLEYEMEKNFWLAMNPDEDLIFKMHAKSKWDAALAKLGVYKDEFNPNSGFA